MKVRSGFVSNSSSSSFVLIFDEEITSKEVLAKQLGTCTPRSQYKGDWNDVYEDTESLSDVVDVVYKLITKEIQSDEGRPFETIDKAIEYMAREETRESMEEDQVLLDEDYPYLERMFTMDKWGHWHIDWDKPETERLVQIHKEQIKTDYERVSKNRFTYIIEVDDGNWADIEHGNVFRNIIHKRISKH